MKTFKLKDFIKVCYHNIEIIEIDNVNIVYKVEGWNTFHFDDYYVIRVQAKNNVLQLYVSKKRM